MAGSMSQLTTASSDWGDACVRHGLTLLGTLEPRARPALGDLAADAGWAVEHPQGGPALSALLAARKPRRVTIVVTDTTRACPDDVLVPVLLDSLRAAGIAPEQVTILVALGLHRLLSRDEMCAKLGAGVAESHAVVNSEAADRSQFVHLGETSRGCPVWINRLVAEADLVLSTGIIEPHLWAGYSGGRKSVAIGAAGEETIRFHHQPAVFDAPGVGLGRIKGNFFHESLSEIADLAGLAFIVNVVSGGHCQVAHVVAGQHRAAFAQGCARCADMVEVAIERQADIVIAGVPPGKDVNLFQATRSASNVRFSPWPAVRKGGTIIVPALAPEGAGRGEGERRYAALTRAHASPAKLIAAVRRDGVKPGGHKAYLMARTLEYARVVVAAARDPREVEGLHMGAAPSVAAALEEAARIHGPGASVYSLPDGFAVLTSARRPEEEKTGTTL